MEGKDQTEIWEAITLTSCTMLEERTRSSMTSFILDHLSQHSSLGQSSLSDRGLLTCRQQPLRHASHHSMTQDCQLFTHRLFVQNLQELKRRSMTFLRHHGSDAAKCFHPDA